MADSATLINLTGVAALLYYCCFALLIGMAGFVLVRAPRSRQNQTFALLSLSLFAWLLTLFLFDRTTTASPLLLLLGRLNFAAVAFASFLAFRLVLALAAETMPRSRLLATETIVLGIASSCTPFIDRAERIGAGGRHITTYGALFPLYILHVSLFLGAAVLAALAARRRSGLAPGVRDQLLLVGAGMLTTGAIALVTNVLLPYSFGNFRFIDVGTLSTGFFLLAIAYAVVRHHLFDVRVFIRRTLVYGILLSLVVAMYSAAVLLVTDHLTQDVANGYLKFGVLIIASSFDPLRRFLEKRVDALLFRDARAPRGKQHANESR